MDSIALRGGCEFCESDVIAMISFLALSFQDNPEAWTELEMCRGR